MIFVTVGTHEQAFDRLIKKMDELVGAKKIEDEVFMQIGYSSYEPRHAEWARLVSFEEMGALEQRADVIITHGGPATFMSVISQGKTPIVVPRQLKFAEHVNDHQMAFARQVAQRGYGIEVVEDIEELEAAIAKVKKGRQTNSHSSYNPQFVAGFRTELASLFNK